MVRGDVLLSYRQGDLSYRRRVHQGETVPFIFLLKSGVCLLPTPPSDCFDAGECGISRAELCDEACIGYLRTSPEVSVAVCCGRTCGYVATLPAGYQHATPESLAVANNHRQLYQGDTQPSCEL